VGDMAKVLNPEFFAQNGKPEVVITDPPRAGMHTKVIDQLLLAEPQKIVYVSCNPATQARDIALLAEKYELTKMQAVDMFPQTHHVENVSLLIRK
jgi:23S rRNA (uracil1939-C5)-methyltransferase